VIPCLDQDSIDIQIILLEALPPRAFYRFTQSVLVSHR